MKSPYLLIADHASNHVPPDIDLGIDPALLNAHIAIDLGVQELGEALCHALACPGLFATISRLVIDLNREEEAAALIPLASDGHAIPGNANANRAERIARFYPPWHSRIATQIAAERPSLILSLHSFTPQLRTAPDAERPWEIGILYNQDARAAKPMLRLLQAAGVCAGDNQPYSGKLLNATMNRHAEANGIAYLGIEVRQDLIADAAGVAYYAALLAAIIPQVLSALE